MIINRKLTVLFVKNIIVLLFSQLRKSKEKNGLINYAAFSKDRYLDLCLYTKHKYT